MLWKVWRWSMGERPLLVEAEGFDEAIGETRRRFPGACSAQLYDERFDGPRDDFERLEETECRKSW